MDTPLEARLCSILCPLLEKSFIGREEITEQFSSYPATHCVTGRITGEWRRVYEYRLKGGVILVRTNTPVSILGIPAGSKSIVAGYRHRSIDAGGTRRIELQVIFENLFVHYIIPALAGIEVGIGVRAESGFKCLQFSHIFSKIRRGPGAELATAVE